MRWCVVVLCACGRIGFETRVAIDADVDAEPAAALCANGVGFLQLPIAMAGKAPRSVELADVDGDGKRDAIQTDGDDATLSIYRGNNGTFMSREVYATNVHPW